MSLRLLLIWHASTRAVRRAAFSVDEPLDEQGKTRATALAGSLPRASKAWCGPSLRTRQTASALELLATVDPALREWDVGRWRGRTLAALQAEEPAAVTAWLSDPAAAPHGGESLLDLLRRAGAWLDDRRESSGQGIAITHAAVIRAAIVQAIGATPASFWRIDVAPLSRTVLLAQGERWSLRSMGQSAK